MQDRPTSLELIRAVREALEREVAPGLADARLRYPVLIAPNVLGIVERELPGEDERLAAEFRALDALLGHEERRAPETLAALRQAVLDDARELCERIRAGAADAGPWRARVLAHVGAMVEDKLAINDPQRLETLSRGAGPGSPP